MNIMTNYNIYKNYSAINMKATPLKEKPMEKTAENILRTLCDFNAHALSGYARAELPCQQVAGDSEYTLEHYPARHVRPLLGIPADEIHAADSLFAD